MGKTSMSAGLISLMNFVPYDSLLNRCTRLSCQACCRLPFSDGYDQHSKNKAPVLGNSIPFFGCETKTGVEHVLVFFNINLCSATSMESSRRDLFNDVADHESILKNNQNTYYPRFSFTPKTGMTPKTIVLF